MNANKLHRRWQSSLEARQADIQKLLRRRRILAEADVHNLRVAVRRARLLVEVGAKSLHDAEARKFRSVAKRLLDALTDLRDLDVTIDWLQTHGAGRKLAQSMAVRRAGFWRKAKRQMSRIDIGKLKVAASKKPEPKKLVRRLRKLADTLTADCLQAVKQAPELSIPELHELRRKVRRWRYVRELEIAPHQIRRDRRLKTLIEVQEALGAMQNAEVILEQLKPLGRTKELQTLRVAVRATFNQAHREALQQIKRLEGLA